MFGFKSEKSDAQLADELRNVLKCANGVGAKLLERGYNLKYEMNYDNYALSVKVQKITTENI